MAVRFVADGLAVKAKLTTPLVAPVMVNHDESLTGANGPVKLAVAGSTTGNKSEPLDAGSVLGVAIHKGMG